MPFAGSAEPVAALLVVDDVDATRTGLVELLRLRGYEAHGARNGAEGLQTLREQPAICVVVLDLSMPGTDGYWFREQQLKDPDLAHVPVVVFTGAGRLIDGALQGCDVLIKPFSLDHLLQAIARSCRKGGGRAQDE
jgi:CheY-like chemotaxis protein